MFFLFWLIHKTSHLTRLNNTCIQWVHSMFYEHGVIILTHSINYWHTCTQHPNPSQNSCVWCTCVSTGTRPRNHDSLSVLATRQTPGCWISSDYILYHTCRHTHCFITISMWKWVRQLPVDARPPPAGCLQIHQNEIPGVFQVFQTL